MVPLGSATSLADLVMALRRPLVGNRNLDALKIAMQAGQQLHNELWLPIEKHLTGIDTVIISPDTALGTLPFAALPGKKNGSYLIEDYRIASMPMTNLLRTLSEDDAARPRNTGLLVLGDVDYNAKPGPPSSVSETSQRLALVSEQSRLARSRGGKLRQWASLPGFRDELDTVRSIYLKYFGSDVPVTTLSGKQATEASFLEAASHVGTLHLITHGYFEDGSVKSIDQVNIKHDAIASQTHGPDPLINTWMPGLLSGLVLAGANKASSDPGDPRDGILRASEIEAASLQGVDLVVLSACETGLGAVAGGEGLTGLLSTVRTSSGFWVVCAMSNNKRLESLFCEGLRTGPSKWDSLGDDLPEDQRRQLCELLEAEFKRRQAANVSSGSVSSGLARPNTEKMSKSIDSTLARTTRRDTEVQPQHIGDYRILNVIAVHGQGIIYRADHAQLNRQVVIKVSKNALSERSRQALIEEGRTLALLSHPNIAQIFDLRIEGGCPCLVMEYIEGRNLADCQTDAPMPSGEAAQLVRTLALAMQHAHGKGIIHRDLKPANVAVRAVDKEL